MSSCKNLAVEKLLLKLRQHLWRISTGNSGNVVRNLVVDGRRISVRTRKSGMIELEIKRGSTTLYAYYNGRDKLVYSGSTQSDRRTEIHDDAMVLYLLREDVKRAFPGYHHNAVAYKAPTTKKGRHRMKYGETVPY